MAIIGNRSTEQGDILIIKPEIPIVGWLSLISFTDDVVEDVDDYFQKEFRYSLDGGLNLSEWTALTNPNLASVTIDSRDRLIIEVRYEHVGGGTDEVEFNSILLNGTTEALNYPLFNNTHFSKFFDIKDLEVFGWALNVLEKIYKSGILADYVDRAYNSIQDADLIALWNVVTEYLAMNVIFIRQFQNIPTNETLLKNYLEARGVYLNDGMGMDGFVYILENLYTEIGKRGTNQIVKLEDITTPIDGELLRIINHLPSDEFIFALLQPHEIGWTIGKSSPCYSGTDSIVNLIKAYEFTKAIVDLNKYPLTNPSYISIDGDYMKVTNVPVGTSSGIGDSTSISKAIVVDDTIDYEVNFRVKVNNPNVLLTFGIYGYGILNERNDVISAVNGGTNNLFIDGLPVNRADTEYWVRGIIWGKSEANRSDTLNIGIGNHLRFPQGVAKISPIVTMKSTATTDEVYITDFKIRPLKMPKSLGMLGVKNYIQAWLKNNSHRSDSEVIRIIRDELLPYDTTISNVMLDTYIQPSVPLIVTMIQPSAASITIQEASGGGDVIVDWGDGNSDAYIGGITSSVSHNYAVQEEHLITLSSVASLTKLISDNNQLTNLDIATNIELVDLYCYNNQLTNLDIATNIELVDLYCYNNQLTNLNTATNTALKYLRCDSNQLTNLDTATNTALEYLSCNNNQLTSLNTATNTALIYLRCDSNQLTNLDTATNTLLDTLYCHYNQLTSLDTATNTALVSLSCHNNQITSLDIATNIALKYLYCDNNQLTSLNIAANTALDTLYCHYNQITSLDTATNTALKYLYCYDNQLTNLDTATNIELEYLSCNNNQLTSLDIATNIALKYLYCDNNQLATVSVNSILVNLDNFGLVDGYLNTELQDPLAPPTGAGVPAKDNLIGKGWGVTTD
jgi:Leucine-rich repeat (LRR) protein